MDQQRLILLLQRYHNSELTAIEREELLSVPDIEIETLATAFENETFAPYIFKDGEANIRISLIVNSDIVDDKPLLKIKRFNNQFWWAKYAAAIIILFSIGAYFWNTKQKTAATEISVRAVNKDISPGFNRAVLTLSNGEKVELNNSVTELINDGNLSIKNQSGQLTYLPIPSVGGVDATGSNLNSNKSGVGYNTMSTPKGGQYQLTLSDGTKVWLNAASSITYPTAFNEKKREVKITGEAYFEVKTNKEKPFIVKTLSEEITVLGTSFNVNNYFDETDTKVSLIEGSVKVNNAVLKPGQAYIDEKITTTNIDEDIAWKNGYFNMHGADIQTVMRNISRWYDVEVVYKRKIPGTFTIDISRNTPLSDVLKILGATGKLNISIQDRKVIIQ